MLGLEEKRDCWAPEAQRLLSGTGLRGGGRLEWVSQGKTMIVSCLRIVSWVSLKAAIIPFQMKPSSHNTCPNPTSVVSKLYLPMDTSCLLSLTGYDMTILGLTSFCIWTRSH